MGCQFRRNERRLFEYLSYLSEEEDTVSMTMIDARAVREVKVRRDEDKKALIKNKKRKYKELQQKFKDATEKHIKAGAKAEMEKLQQAITALKAPAEKEGGEENEEEGEGEKKEEEEKKDSDASLSSSESED